MNTHLDKIQVIPFFSLIEKIEIKSKNKPKVATCNKDVAFCLIAPQISFKYKIRLKMVYTSNI